MVYVCIIVIYFKRIKRILLEKMSESETIEVMKLNWPYYEKYLFLCGRIEYLREIQN